MERGIRVVKQNRIRTVSFYALTLPYAEFENKKTACGWKKMNNIACGTIKVFAYSYDILYTYLHGNMLYNIIIV